WTDPLAVGRELALDQPGGRDPACALRQPELDKRVPSNVHVPLGLDVFAQGELLELPNGISLVCPQRPVPLGSGQEWPLFGDVVCDGGLDSLDRILRQVALVEPLNFVQSLTDLRHNVK